MNRVLKIFVIGLPLIGVFYGIYFGYFPNAPDIHRKEDIIGTWATNGSYSYDEQGVIVSTKARTSYFSNGKYNVSGEMSYRSDKINNVNLFISYRVNGAGEWQINDKELVISLNNLKSAPNKIIYNGEEVDIQNIYLVEKLTNKKFPAVEDMMADGASQSYQIIIDNHNYKKLDVINPFGENYSIQMYRVK